MFLEDNPFMTLCAVASTFRDQDASTSGMQEQHVASPPPLLNQDIVFEKAQRKTKTNITKHAQKSCTSKRPAPCVRNVHASVKSRKLEEGIDLKSIPNHRITEYIENTSDEISKKFSFKCKFAPNVCSEVKESYGNDERAFNEMKRHLMEQHLLVDLIPETATRSKQVKSKSARHGECSSKTPNEDMPKPAKSCRSLQMKRVVAFMQINGGKSIVQQTEKTDEEEMDDEPLDACFEDNDSTGINGILNTVKCGEFEHTYAKSSDGIPPVRETGQKKNRRQNIDTPFPTFDVNEILDTEVLHVRPIIPTEPFPYVYTPCPLEAVCNIELDSNGDPVVVEEPVFIQPSTSRISSKQVMENKLIRKKSKISLVDNSSRSVLECVENRVACKSNASADQKDSLLQDDSIENSENVEKSIRDVAWRNIQMLRQQRKKRKYRDRPSVYICEICNKNFTANTSLTHHYMGHLKIKPFKCNICYRTFTRRHSLKYHMMIHANKNRFQCGTCKRLFRHPSHYKEHLRKHTGEEPFSCKFCPNKFKTRNSFKRHLKMQHQKLLTSNGIVPIHNDS